EESLAEDIPLLRPLALILGIGLAGVMAFVFWTTLRGKPFAGLRRANAPGYVQALGRVLFTKYLFPFEVASVFLIIAAIGAMVLGRRRDEEEEASQVLTHAPGAREPEN